MLYPIFTLDYEIHGNGEGCPFALMVEPTDQLLRLFDEYGAKLTIMADVAEIMKFKQHFSLTGKDAFGSQAIEKQLQNAIERGHDVQLHIHSSYFRAWEDDGRWIQDWSEYNFAELPIQRMDWMVRMGKQYLESLLRPIDPLYRCEVFRAANWAVSPSRNVINVLIKNGIRVDTSVFKYGCRRGLVEFDYSNAPSALIPWRVSFSDFCQRDDSGRLWEFPIYTETRRIGAFVTLQRFNRAFLGRFHRLPQRIQPPEDGPAGSGPSEQGRIRKILGLHAWKADFNQCTGRQLVGAIDRAEERFGQDELPLPFVLIGHSKLFSRLNRFSLRPFLDHIRAHPERYRFGRFGDFFAGEDSQSSAFAEES